RSGPLPTTLPVTNERHKTRSLDRPTVCRFLPAGFAGLPSDGCAKKPTWARPAPAPVWAVSAEQGMRHQPCLAAIRRVREARPDGSAGNYYLRSRSHRHHWIAVRGDPEARVPDGARDAHPEHRERNRYRLFRSLAERGGGQRAGSTLAFADHALD